MARIVFGPPLPRDPSVHAMTRLMPSHPFSLSVMESVQDAADRLSGGTGLSLLTSADGTGKVFVNRANVLWIAADDED